MITRLLKAEIVKYVGRIPVIAIIGARQVGKTTLVKTLIQKGKETIFLDLEKSSDRLVIAETENFLNLNKEKTICIDEIQMMPSLFSELRNFVDNNKDTQIIVLGSSSPDLLRNTSESLAGRIYYFELSPFLWKEVKTITNIQNYILVGGLPLSMLAKTTDESFMWLENFIRTFLERDLRNFGFNIAPDTLRRLWKMLAHNNGQVLNSSQLGNAMGLSHTTINKYIDILANTFMLRILQPYHTNLKKRLIKSPKVYFRDTGILNSLLNINTFDELFSHPVYGTAWEIIVIENIINKYKGWDFFFYRTASGNEIDLVLTKAKRVIAIEIKASTTPKLGRGFWQALDDIQATEAYVIAQVNINYPMKNNVMVYSLNDFLEKEI
ncbi:MAG: ATPase [Bacteroidetes bacterium 4572_112]|nr:MAG: ATPase [Bacteroidetes bacterium 4572_112]